MPSYSIQMEFAFASANPTLVTKISLFLALFTGLTKHSPNWEGAYWGWTEASEVVDWSATGKNWPLTTSQIGIEYELFLWICYEDVSALKFSLSICLVIFWHLYTEVGSVFATLRSGRGRMCCFGHNMRFILPWITLNYLDGNCSVTYWSHGGWKRDFVDLYIMICCTWLKCWMKTCDFRRIKMLCFNVSCMT